MQCRSWLNGLIAFAMVFLSLVQARPALADELFRSDEWLALLHYQDDFLGVKGSADNADFYLSPEGRTNPAAEFEATAVRIGSSLKIRCAFPARAHFLQRHGLPVAVGPCPEFAKFKAKLATKSVTFIFADAYPNNPASMFGHALLRLNRDNSGAAGGVDLLNNSVAFLAKTEPSDDPLSYTMKGLFGGYPGYFSIDPYYTTVTLYNDGENRDLWEYDLDLTDAEVNFLVEHLFELATKASFDYYFYDENCAYQLLALLEAVRPTTRLTKQTRFFVMPLDAVRDVHQAFGLAASPRHRTSLKSQMLDAVERLNSAQRETFEAVRQGRQSETENIDVATADASIAYFNYAMYEAKAIDPKGRALLRAMNVRRAQLGPAVDGGAGDQRNAALSPDQGHAPMRLAVGGGRVLNGADFLEFSARPGFHDLLNDDRGYGSLAAIHYLDLHIRANQATQKVSFERLTLAEVTSLSPFDYLTKPWSWRLGLAVQRVPGSFDVQRREVRGEAAGGLTLATSSNHFATYLLANAVAEGLSVGPGFAVGVIFRAFEGSAKWATEAFVLKDWTEHDDSRGVTSRAAWSWTKSLDLRVEGQWRHAESQVGWYRELQAGLGWQI